MAEIIDFEIPTAANPYTQDVADLIAAGDGKALALVVPTDHKNAHRRKFSKAANDAGKTARLRVEEVVKGDDGEPILDSEGKTQTRLVFTLTGKHEPRRGKGETDTPVEPSEAPEIADDSAPVDEAVKPAGRNRK